MSREKPRHERRPYRKRRRAELEDATRRRITEAAVDLHATVGPAKTTISAVAERAGVQRATVYRHFPDEEALFAACSAHWAGLNPPPDPTGWRQIADPDERLTVALGALYAWYARPQVESILVNTARDASLVPAMERARAQFLAWYDAATDALGAGRGLRGARRRRARAAILHALAFETWRSLVREGGLEPAEAIDLMAGLVREAAA